MAVSVSAPGRVMAGSKWEPTVQGMNQILQLLHDSQTTNNEQQKLVYQQLQKCETHPEFTSYLSHVMLNGSLETEIRCRAGLLLKNSIRYHYNQHSTDDIRDFILGCSLTGISDAIPVIRRTAGTVLATMIVRGQSELWYSIVPRFLSLLHQPMSVYSLDGLLSCLSILFEEGAIQIAKFETDDGGIEASTSLSDLFAALITLIQHEQVNIRLLSLTSVQYFLFEGMPQALNYHMPMYLSSLYHLMSDPNRNIQAEICSGLCKLLDVRYEMIQPQMRQIMMFLISVAQQAQESSILEVGEFWTKFCSNDDNELQVLKEFLPHIIPILLQGMHYSEDDPALLFDQEDDEHVPDRPENIKPRFHNSRASTLVNQNEDSASECDDDDQFADLECPVWNLRKSSASTLDKLAVTFRDELLHPLLPLLQEHLANVTQWKSREVGVLALGAIAEGCIQGLSRHLSDLVPYLTQLLLDAQPLIRSISCWTLSRYSNWIAPHELLVKPTLEGVLGRVLDKNKKVQEAACSSLSILEGAFGQKLIPFLTPIVNTLMFAFQKYQTRNRVVLYDTIGSLADAVGKELASPALLSTLVEPLLIQWQNTSNDDTDMFPMLECITFIAQASGSSYLRYAGGTFERCLAIMLYHSQVTQEDHRSDGREFIVCCLDLLSGLCEAIQHGMMGLLSTSGNASSRLFSLMYDAAKDSSSDVRQSAIALVGDLAKCCIEVIKPHLELFIQMILPNIDPRHVAVCNNASWAIGEMALQLGPALDPHIPQLLSRLEVIVTNPSISRRLQENTSITLGRLSLVCPTFIAEHLDRFLGAWCAHLTRYREDQEKEIAFRGLISVVMLNHLAVQVCFPAFCVSLGQWQSLPPTLSELFGQLLHSLKHTFNQLNPPRWTQAMETLQPDLQQYLTQQYRL